MKRAINYHPTFPLWEFSGKSVIPTQGRFMRETQKRASEDMNLRDLDGDSDTLCWAAVSLKCHHQRGYLGS